MKSKQEVIQEAYDKTFPDSSNYSFDKIRSAVDENGWYRFVEGLTVNICTTGFDYDKGAYRPKSLRGIENNNGWTRIDSEEDLPKKDGTYYVMTKYGMKSLYWMNVMGKIYNVEKWMEYKPTHYLLEVVPNPPIY